MTITEMMAKYAESINKDSISSETLNIARRVVFDVIGCMLAGTRERVVNLMTDHTREYGGKPMATVLGQNGFKTDLCHAAMINAMSAHVHDIDDICIAVDAHPSVAILATAISVGEYVDASGEDVLIAYIAGIEAASLLGQGLFAKGYSYGWDTNGTVGVFGTTVAAAKLLKLTLEETINALGIAASEASGLRASYGTMTKDISAGTPAYKGVFACLMAKAGFDSRRTIMEDVSGLLAVSSNGADVELMKRIADERISSFVTPGILQKLYSTCRGTHSSIDAALAIANKYDYKVEDIEKVVSRAQSTAAANNRYPMPDSPMQGKFSIPYCMAIALIYKELDMSFFFTDSEITDKKVIELTKKGSVEIDTSFNDSIARTGAEVSVYLKDGTVYTERVNYPKGDPSNPLTRDELVTKFRKLAGFHIAEENLDDLIDMVEELDRLKDIRTLIGYLNNVMK